MPIVEKVLQSSSVALDQIHTLLQKIQQSLENIFDNGNWEIDISNKGNVLYPDWYVLTIHKKNWVEEANIYLSSMTGIGKMMAFSFYYNGFTLKKYSKSVLDTFRKIKTDLGLKEVTQDEEHPVINILSQEFGDWLDGSVFDNDLRYILNSEQENAIISNLIKCSQAFLSIEETLDAIALEE